MRTSLRPVLAFAQAPVAAVLTAMTLILTGIPGQAHAGGLYRPPDMEKDIFISEKVMIGRFERAGLVSGLVSVARDFDEEDGVDFELRAHALAIAGRLDKDSENFGDTSRRLIYDARTLTREGATTTRTAWRIYRIVRDWDPDQLHAKGDKNTLKCAAYCADIALRVDPDGKHAIKIKELRDKLANNKISADWRGMLKAPVHPGPRPRPRPKPFEVTMTGGEADKFALEQSAVKSLVVVSIGNGKYDGAASSIVASAVLDDGSGKITFQPKGDMTVGPMMASSIESVVTFLRLRHEDVPKIVPSGYKIDIVFEDDDEFLDGPSSGTAMALLLDSLFTGDEIDQNFACAGGITPAGNVTRVHGVAAKIREATRGKCTVVGVPAGNAAGVADILVLDGIDQLLDIQVFAMKDYEQAKEISCRQKDAKVAEALEAFATVADRIRKEGEAAVKSPAIQKQLEEVLGKMPNHLSARLLIDHAKGKAPGRLSLDGSFHQIDSNASGVFSTAQMMLFRKKYDHSNPVVETAREATGELRKLQGKIDERLVGYLNDALKVCELIEAGKGGDNEGAYFKRLESAWKPMMTERRKLMDDPELRGEMGL